MENPDPGPQFRATFDAEVTDRLVASLRRAYGTACELYAPERGSSEATFGFNLYHHAMHEIVQAADAAPDLVRVLSQKPTFRFRIGPYELGCYRVGMSDKASIWSSFPASEAAIGLVVDEACAMPLFHRGASSFAEARKLVLAHLGNVDEGLRAAYLCIPGQTDGKTITGWAFAHPIWIASDATAGKPAVETPVLVPEIVVEEPVVRRKPKRAAHEATG
jgi:hypothetical protein